MLNFRSSNLISARFLFYPCFLSRLGRTKLTPIPTIQPYLYVQLFNIHVRSYSAVDLPPHLRILPSPRVYPIDCTWPAPPYPGGVSASGNLPSPYQQVQRMTFLKLWQDFFSWSSHYRHIRQAHLSIGRAICYGIKLLSE